jgi:hypothetical protein
MNGHPYIEILTFIVSLATFAVVLYQAFLSRDIARRQLRAYLGVGEPRFGEKFPTKITIEVENGGQTPACRVWAHLNTRWFPAGEGIPANFDFADLGEIGAGSVAHINPGQKRAFTFPIDSRELDRARNGEIDWFCYGHIDYVDIYQVTRTSKFFYSYKGVNGPEGAVTHALVMQKTWNEAE